METISRADRAYNAFKSGYNCAQSVAVAFADKLEMDESVVAKLTSGFGGGMGRLRETCGAISGSVFVISALYGYDDSNSGEEKARLYSEISAIGEQFKSEFGTVNCATLLKGIKTTLGSIPEERTAKYYGTRPCVHFVVRATELVEEYINQKEQENN